MVYYGCEVFCLSVRILAVTPGSAAEKAGIRPDDWILSVNGVQIQDEIDYQALTAAEIIRVEIETSTRTVRTFNIRKEEWEPLGLCLDETEAMKPRHCRNRCMFCFVDQLPQGMRETLYVKDDDWRLSLMMGNFVTLTNVDDREFDRILRRKASPLYISVHATDPEVRIRMLKNPQAGKLLDRLKTLKDHGLKFHCQVVLCPGINDGPVLHQTIVDLAALYPSALSLAIVPVGLTGHREGLTDLRMMDQDQAKELVRDLELIQAYYLRTIGTRFVYASDELYCIAGLPVPPEEAYEGYPQIENGVGMLRQLAQECEDYWPLIREAASRPGSAKRHLIIPTGVSAFPYIQELVKTYARDRVQVRVIPVVNRYFGETVTVTGLIVGRDLLEALRGVHADEILISASMLRENTDSFLDDMTLAEVQKEVGIPFRVVPNTGESFLNALYGLEETACQNRWLQ